MREVPVLTDSVSPGTAIRAARRGLVTGATAQVFAVRFARETNPTFGIPTISGYVWVVRFRHDSPIPSSCPIGGCARVAAGKRVPPGQTNVVVDARTGRAFFKFG
ncbi:MAG: hypothetical protein ACRDFX_11845 [Chloroflexota bacterium]